MRLRIIKYLILVVVTLMIIGSSVIWRSPKYYNSTTSCNNDVRVLTMQQYNLLSKTHKRPFKIKTENVFVYGAEHTKDPKNIQIADLEKEWQKFKPTVLLVEGRLGFLIPFLMNPVKTFGENGKAVQLARRDNIDIYSWELPKSELIKLLRPKYSAEQLALSEILKPYFSSHRFGIDNPEKFVEGYLHRAQWFGLENSIKSIKDIEQLWQKYFPTINWKTTSDQYGLPGYLQNVANNSNFYRNQHLICNIKSLINKGERVFVVCGSSHAVCIKSSIKNENIRTKI